MDQQLPPPHRHQKESHHNGLILRLKTCAKALAFSKAIAHRPEAYFDSWRVALQRYNGRTDTLRDGRSYRAAYADRILRRVRNPGVFVPIAFEHGHE